MTPEPDLSADTNDGAGLGGTQTIVLLAPFAGTVVALADVPDPVFAGSIVGPGTAIEPLSAEYVDGLVRVVAPVSGTVATLFPHAIAIEVDSERAVLVHLGIDTVSLAGEGFTTLVAVGQSVFAGQEIFMWSPALVAGNGMSTVTPIVAVQAPEELFDCLVEPGTSVAPGDALAVWRV